MQVSSSREHPPGQTSDILEKNCQMPAIFVNKCPAPRSFYEGQLPGLPVRQTNIQNLVASFKSTELFQLNKTAKNRLRNETLQPNKKKANGLISFIGLLWSINALLIPKCRYLKLLTSERQPRRMLRSKFCCCLQMPGGRRLIMYQMPGVCPGG